MVNAGRRRSGRRMPEDGRGRRPTRDRAPGAGPALSEDELFDRFQHPLTVLFGWFFLRHLHDLYLEFDGDMVMPMVLGEIAHHNISHWCSYGRVRKGAEPSDWEDPALSKYVAPCNTLSLSEATGIPRETCRRKVRDLLRQGLIRRHPKGGYVIEQGLGERYRALNRRTFSAYLKLMDDVNALLSDARP